MRRYEVKITNDLHEVRIYTTEANTVEEAESKARLTYQFTAKGNITDVRVR